MVYFNDISDLKKLEEVLVAKRKYDEECKNAEIKNNLSEPASESPTKKLNFL